MIPRTRPLLSLLLVATIAAGAARAQSPTFFLYGTGCEYAGQRCRIGNLGLPRLGHTFAITYDGPNTIPPLPWRGLDDIQPHLALGFVSRLPTPLPQSWFPSQPAGCASLVDAAVVLPQPEVFSAVPTRSYQDSVVLQVPNDPQLLGAVFFTQWWTVVRDSLLRHVRALLASDAAILVVGR